MAKKGIIFRKIGGRLVPIRIKNVRDAITEASDRGGSKFRKIVAELPDKSAAGTMHVRVPKKGKSSEVVAVEVRKEFRRRGISRELFKKASDFLSRAGKKYLRSEDIQHPAQVKIRAKAGWFKAGKTRLRSRFLADQFGPYGEQTKRVGPKTAIDILKQNKTPHGTGRQVKGTTMIRKKKK